MYEVEMQQIFETLEGMRDTVDAPGYLLDIIRDDLYEMFVLQKTTMPPDDILEVYMDSMEYFSEKARSEKTRSRFESIASLVKTLKEFYSYDIFDKYLNHPEED